MRVEYNLTGLTDIDDESGEFVNDMLKLFVQSVFDGGEEIKRFSGEKKWSLVSEKAHQLLGPCRHLGVEPLTSTLKELMDCASKKNSDEMLPSMVVKMESEILETITVFRKLIKE